MTSMSHILKKQKKRENSDWMDCGREKMKDTLFFFFCSVDMSV